MSIKNLFDQYETMRAESVYEEEVETRVVTLRIPAIDFAFLNVLAGHYRATRSGFVRDVLEDGMQQFFTLLPPDQRMTMAQNAHDLYMQDMKKTCGDGFQLYGFTKWIALAKLMEQKPDQEHIPVAEEVPL